MKSSQDSGGNDNRQRQLLAGKANRALCADSISVPGDKSISHRALLLSSQAIGISKITGLLEGEDVLATAQALRQLGVGIDRIAAASGNGVGRGNSNAVASGDGGDIDKSGRNQSGQVIWQVQGVGVSGLSESDDVLDMGNSGTAARLLMGLVAPYDFVSFFSGDASLRARPMARVLTPLMQMGVQAVSRDKGRLPLAIIGKDELIPIEYELPVASAQVKSAIMLAALGTLGKTTIIEPKPTRDHSELMLRALGAEIIVEKISDKADSKANAITITGQPQLFANSDVINVPADPSSAAFLVVAALIVPGSEIVIKNLCINPHRIGLYKVLQEMGADIEFANHSESAGEQIADLVVRYNGVLSNISVPAEIAPSMIDEYPILAVLCAFSDGVARLNGLEELRVKESDRFAVIIAGLNACGIQVSEEGDDMVIHGIGNRNIEGGAAIKTYMDHRIAMSFAVMGQRSDSPIKIDDGSMIATSFPNFLSLMNEIGANIFYSDGS